MWTFSLIELFPFRFTASIFFLLLLRHTNRPANSEWANEKKKNVIEFNRIAFDIGLKHVLTVTLLTSNDLLLAFLRKQLFDGHIAPSDGKRAMTNAAANYNTE